MQTYQIRNDELVDILTPDFQGRYENNFAWKSAVSATLALPALRAFWPMSAVDFQNPQCLDMAGGGHDLTNNNVATFGYGGLVPYVEFDGVNQYLSRADGGVGNWADILGTETYIIAAQRGLTLGGWFYIDVDGGSSMLLMGKLSGGGVNRSYNLSWITGTQFPQVNVASGAVDYTVVGTLGTTGTAAPAGWNLFCCRFIPSTQIDVFLNRNYNTNNVGIPANINDTAASFTIGATGIPGNYLDGRASLCFLCAAALSDSIITALFEQQRAAFGI